MSPRYIFWKAIETEFNHQTEMFHSRLLTYYFTLFPQRKEGETEEEFNELFRPCSKYLHDLIYKSNQSLGRYMQYKWEKV